MLIFLRPGLLGLLICILIPLLGGDPGEGRIRRTDHRVPLASGEHVAVRLLEPRRLDRDQPPLLLLHGARVPGLASFDLPVPGGSLAADLARTGRKVVIVDARGYGGSSRPPEMSRPATESAPLMTGEQVVSDLRAVVDWLGTPVDLLGWATGGHWAAWYASEHPDRVRNLIIYNSLYGELDDHPTLGRGSSYEDPDRPGEFDDSIGGYRFSSGTDLLRGWDESIPVEEKAAWRDPRVAEAYVTEALASDPTSDHRDPPSFRAPTGALKDSFMLATGRQLWRADKITARTLILRSELDFWSRPGDPVTLAEDLSAADELRSVELSEATHFVHLDRSEHGRRQFLTEVVRWLRR